MVLLRALIFLGAIVYSGFASAGSIIPAVEVVHHPDRIEDIAIHMYVDMQYYSDGDITFIYPEGLFSEAPYVVASIALSGSVLEGPDLGYFPVILSNTASSAIVRVNHKFLETIAANPDKITVMIQACGR